MQLSQTLSYRSQTPINKWRVFFLLMLFAVGYMVSHAIYKHGESAIAVRNCVSSGGTVEQWHNPETGRVALVCQLDQNMFGIQIIENIDNTWQEITAFIKNKLTRIEQVHRYLKNTGYQPMK